MTGVPYVGRLEVVQTGDKFTVLRTTTPNVSQLGVKVGDVVDQALLDKAHNADFAVIVKPKEPGIGEQIKGLFEGSIDFSIKTPGEKQTFTGGATNQPPVIEQQVGSSSAELDTALDVAFKQNLPEIGGIKKGLFKTSFFLELSKQSGAKLDARLKAQAGEGK